MKNILIVLTLSLPFLSPACKDKCDQPVAIQKLQPNADPAGYEIFIAATGVSASTKVTFDAVDAASVKMAEGGLIVKVPTGVSGSVTLSIEEGECSDSKPFEVLGTYPGNVPVGSTSIIVPQPPAGYPSDITNPWPNAFDDNHEVFLSNQSTPFGILEPSSKERQVDINASTYNPYLDDNPVSGFVDTVANSIFLVIDRSAKVGGFKDTLTGQFIHNLSSTVSYTMLLVSKRTGRQLVLVK